MRTITAFAICIATIVTATTYAAETPVAGKLAFERGLPTAPGFFPMAVWLQSPRNAVKFKDLGINLYVGLWRGPNEEQLAALEKAGMPVICDMNAFARRNLDRRIIVAWMHGDEPDNAQALPGGEGYGPPIKPEKIVEDYQRLRAADPSRPVMLNLGQGVAWDGWHGRGVRTRHPEDYPEYAKGSDIVSFDIYPVVHDNKQIAGNLWYVPFGVDRLRKWVNDEKPVWACIEAARISNVQVKPTPRQIRSEVWMAIIHGAKGLIYFTHQFKPTFIEAGMLADAEIGQGVRKVNAEIQSLAPVLNTPTLSGAVAVESESRDVPVDVMVKREGKTLYIFAASMRAGTTTATFKAAGFPKLSRVSVLGENRTIDVSGGAWKDRFEDYEVHIYRGEAE